MIDAFPVIKTQVPMPARLRRKYLLATLYVYVGVPLAFVTLAVLVLTDNMLCLVGMALLTIGIAIRRWKYGWVALALLMSLLTLVDLAFGIPVAWPFCIPVSLLYGPTVIASQKRVPVTIGIATIVWLCVLPYIDTNPTKRFQRAFIELEEGMTVDEVIDQFERLYGEEVPPHYEYLGGIRFVMCDDSAETIYLDLAEGRVIAMCYSPD